MNPATTIRESPSESMGALARGAAVNMAGSVFNFVSRLAFNLAVARVLGAGSLGLYYLALMVGSMLGVAAVGGFNAALVRYLALYREQRDWGAFRGTLQFTLRVVSALGLLGSLIMFAGAHWIAGPLFHKPELAVPLRVFALYVPLFGLEQLLLFATQSFKQMKYKVYVESILNPALRLLLLLVIYLMGWGLNALLASYVFTVFVCAAVSFPALKRCLAVNLEDFQPTCNRRELLAYTYPLLGVNALTFALLYTDSIVLGHYRTASELGLYSVCVRLMLVTAASALPVVTQIFAPMIAELQHRGEIAQLGAYFKVTTLWGVEIFIPLVILFAGLPHQILALFGREFPAAAPALMILAIGQFTNVLTGPVGQVLVIGGWTRLQLWNTLALLSLQVALCFALIPRWGLTGAAIANTVAMGGINILQVIQVHRRLNIHPFSLALCKPLVAWLVAMAAAVPLWQNSMHLSVYRLALLCAGMGFAYAGMLVAFGLDRYSRIAWQHVRGSLRARFAAATYLPFGTGPGGPQAE